MTPGRQAPPQPQKMKKKLKRKQKKGRNQQAVKLMMN